MATDRDLEALLRRAMTTPDRVPPAARIDAFRSAVDAYRQDVEAPVMRPRPRRERRRWLPAAALAVAALAIGVAVGSALTADDGDRIAGEQEFAGPMRGPSGAELGTVEVVKIGEGRVVRLDIDDLPLLPPGDFYEVWFVGTGDSAASPRRISAGTFHPDEQGRAHIRLFAAVDPAKFPSISVTAEPGDGDPAPTGPEVARAEI